MVYIKISLFEEKLEYWLNLLYRGRKKFPFWVMVYSWLELPGLNYRFGCSYRASIELNEVSPRINFFS